MSSLQRAEEICQKLEAAGVRASVDPSALNLPAVLVNMPAERTNDLNCGVTVRWALDCIVPVPVGWDRTAWRLMEDLVTAVEATFPIERSRSQPFNRPGAAGLVNFPSYECSFSEAIE
jgi:hypothetical protein